MLVHTLSFDELSFHSISLSDEEDSLLFYMGTDASANFPPLTTTTPPPLSDELSCGMEIIDVPRPPKDVFTWSDVALVLEEETAIKALPMFPSLPPAASCDMELCHDAIDGTGSSHGNDHSASLPKRRNAFCGDGLAIGSGFHSGSERRLSLLAQQASVLTIS